jgi:iron complex outermembrane receptor protein
MNHEEKLDGASAADKIVGKGAALLYVRGKIENLFAKVISKSSLEVLENENIYIEKEKLVPYIKNRDQTGMCPIETMAEEDGNIDSLLIRIESFLKNNNLI